MSYFNLNIEEYLLQIFWDAFPHWAQLKKRCNSNIFWNDPYKNLNQFLWCFFDWLFYITIQNFHENHYERSELETPSLNPTIDMHYPQISTWFDLKIFLLYINTIGIGHKFQNLDRPFPVYNICLVISLSTLYKRYTQFYHLQTGAVSKNQNAPNFSIYLEYRNVYWNDEFIRQLSELTQRITIILWVKFPTRTFFTL